jgi:t-SNARE complex subunit (syntaxin)
LYFVSFSLLYQVHRLSHIVYRIFVVSLVKSTDLSNSNGDKQFMAEFFADVEIVKKQMAVISAASVHITDINQRVVLATTAAREQELSDELKPVLNESNKKAQVAKQILQRLREDTERIKTSKEGSKQASEIRIRENLVNTLTRKFVDIMKQYQNVQQKYKQDIKKKVTRQVQIVKPDATTEEVDAVMKSGGTSNLFQSAILKGDASDSISNAFMNAKDKYQDVLTLEASVAELHQMFLDFALLTEQQGEMLDQIEFQVKSSIDYVEEATTHLAQAVELQKSLRYKQCCCIVLTLAIIGAIVGIIYAYSKGKI